MNRGTYNDDGDREKTTDARTQKALQQYLTVLDDTPRVDGADGLYEVVSESGKSYVVDVQLGACECPDHRYRETVCKHIRRTRYATGDVPIPAGVDGVDPDLGRHVDGPRVVATDGGEVESDADGECVAGEDWCSGPNGDETPCLDCWNAARGLEVA